MEGPDDRILRVVTLRRSSAQTCFSRNRGRSGKNGETVDHRSSAMGCHGAGVPVDQKDDAVADAHTSVFQHL